MTDDELRAARELVDAATPGPWNLMEWRHWADPCKRNFTIQHTATDRYNEGAQFALATVELFGSADGSSKANAAFIAAARTLVPRLIDEVERLRKESTVANDRLSSAYKRIHDLESLLAFDLVGDNA